MTDRPATGSAAEPQTLDEALLALATDWDNRLRREYGVDDSYTDWHSQEVRTLLAKHGDRTDDQPTCEHGIALSDLCAFASSRTEADEQSEPQKEIAGALSDLRWQIHAIRFAKEEGTLTGPDNFYNGVIKAEALAREAADRAGSDHMPRWMEGWLAAMDFLAEYKGAEGILIAEEMATRLPAEVIARHQQENP
jgi:hypothetical protein